MSKSFLYRFWAVGVVLCAVAATAPAGPDVLVKPDPANVQNEISLTLIPGQPGTLAMAYNDLGPGFGLGISYSANFGLTWTNTNLARPLAPNGATMNRAFDPSITADASGRLYASFISDGANFANGLYDSGLYVCASSDYGQTWSAPLTVDYQPTPSTPPPDPAFRYNDRDQITSDNFSASPHFNNVYISWIQDRGYYSPAQPWGDIYVSRSTNSGASFTPAQRINDADGLHERSNMPVPAVAANGNLYVSWLDYNVLTGGTGTIFLDRSTDGGATWGTDVTVRANIQLPPLRVKTGAGTTDVLAKGAPVLATDPTNASTLYIAYAALGLLPADDADIFLIKSTDGGTTWSNPLRVNTDNTTADQILPWIKVKPDGTVDIAWYDRSADPADALWDVVITKSTDGGATFGPAVPLTDISFATPNPALYGKWLGEYLGLAVDSTDAYVAFTSSISDINGDIWFDSIPNSHVPEPAALGLLALALVAMTRRRRG